MKKIIIIGGGASGLTAAINAKSNTNEVIILEKNSDCGKKILVTGNGRCNYFNDDQDIKHYHSKCENKLNDFINDTNLNEVLNFFESIGISPEIKDGYYYPKSNQAISVKNALLNEAISRKIKIVNNIDVTNIVKNENKFIIETNNGNYEADVVILATGSKAAPKTGSDGIGYKILKNLGFEIEKPLPGLVQLISSDNLKDASGVRTKAKLSLYENNELIKEEIGELQLTDYGISGICAMQLSSYISKGLDDKNIEEVRINFLPWLEIDILSFVNERNELLKNRTISQLLDGLLNYKLVNTLLKKSNIKLDDLWNDLSNNKKEELCENLVNYKMFIDDTKDFENAQICVGGLSLEEINESFETKIENLYVVGELLDVNGDCGGYNLTFAWLSGIIAGKKIAGDNND